MRQLTLLTVLFAVGTLVLAGCETSTAPPATEHTVQKPAVDEMGTDDLATDEINVEEPALDESTEPATDEFELDEPADESKQ